MQQHRYGSAQARLSIIQSLLQLLLSSSSLFVERLEESEASLFSLFERRQWLEGLQFFLEEASLRYAVNLALCRLRRQLKPLRVSTAPEYSHDLLSFAERELQVLLSSSSSSLAKK